MKAGELFTFLDYSIIICGDNLGANGTINYFTNVEIMLNDIFLAGNTFFCHKRRICSYTIKHTKIAGFTYLIKICSIDKEFHESVFICRKGINYEYACRSLIKKLNPIVLQHVFSSIINAGCASTPH